MHCKECFMMFSVSQTCLTIWDGVNCRPLGSSVHGIFEAKLLEWVAISCSRGSSWPRDQTHLSRISCLGRWILYHWASWEAPKNASVQFSSVQSLSHVQLFATPWTAARQASLSITNSRNPLKPMSIESVMPSNHLILCRPLLLLPQFFPASGSFQMSQLFTSGGQSIGVSASISDLPMNTQHWCPLGWTGSISLQSKGLSRVFNTTVQKHQFFGIQLSL